MRGMIVVPHLCSECLLRKDLSGLRISLPHSREWALTSGCLGAGLPQSPAPLCHLATGATGLQQRHIDLDSARGEDRAMPARQTRPPPQRTVDRFATTAVVLSASPLLGGVTAARTGRPLAQTAPAAGDTEGRGGQTQHPWHPWHPWHIPVHDPRRSHAHTTVH